MNRRNIPFSPPDITDAEIAEVVDTLKSGWITTGPKTKEMERMIAERCNTSMAVCLNSNTACAEMTLRILGIGPGDEVILPAYTYTATASVVDHVGATIVMVDCEKDCFTMDYQKVEDAITPNTKAIIAVDLFGVPCDYNKLYEIVERKRDIFKFSNNTIQRSFGRIAILSDAAHSFGATREGVPTGRLADFTYFSFHAVKNLTTAEGGAVTWKDIPGIDNATLYHKYMLLSLHGQSKDALAKTQLGAWEYNIEGLWYKCNMTDIHAAIGISQLRRYDMILDRRKFIIETQDKAFENLPVKLVRHYTKEWSSSGHLYIMRLFHRDGTPYKSSERNEFIIKMAERGITTNVHYKPLPMHTGYWKLGFNEDDYPNANAIFENVVTLPLHNCLSDEDIGYITLCVRELLG